MIGFAQAMLRRVAAVGGGTPAAWWFTILTLGPVLGSFITEPAAMTICAMLLGRQFYALQPGRRGDDEAVREVAMKAVRKLVRGDIGKRPLVSVHVVRL